MLTRLLISLWIGFVSFFFYNAPGYFNLLNLTFAWWILYKYLSKCHLCKVYYMAQFFEELKPRFINCDQSLNINEYCLFSDIYEHLQDTYAE